MHSLISNGEETSQTKFKKMRAPFALKAHAFTTPFSFLLATFLIVASWQNLGALARVPASRQQIALNLNDGREENVPSLASNKNDSSSNSPPSTLDALLDAIDVMQEQYFDIGSGTWPTSIDWTAAVLGTHISATLSTLISSIDPTTCTDLLAWDNLINRYFSHTSIFYFGENALSLRQQAYDDMLWVVLGWLENIKLMDLYSSKREKHAPPWHGAQFKPSASHRAHIFYDLATHGWDTSLCNGGMVWNAHLRPYKNSITNELFISASVSMYLYFPGDDNDSPFLPSSQHPNQDQDRDRPLLLLLPLPHKPEHLHNAIKAYAWLKASNMTSSTSPAGLLYADGYHISTWRRLPSGHIDPGTGRCDELNSMVYTYNQGVVLTGLRGLYLATGEAGYLEDGHALIEAVVAATGWGGKADNGEGKRWKGLGRGGVLEEYCDAGGKCSQDGQTFKGIFFHHLAEFCRKLSVGGVEEAVVHNLELRQGDGVGFDQHNWQQHLRRCAGYRDWVAHNARAAIQTRDEDGRFGMWWGRAYPDDGSSEALNENLPPLPPGAVDYANGPRVGVERAQGDGSSRSAVSVSGGRGDVNERGRGRTVETQSGGVAVLRALRQWEQTQR